MRLRTQMSAYIRPILSEFELVSVFATVGALALCLVKIMNCGFGAAICDAPTRVLEASFSLLGILLLMAMVLLAASLKGSAHGLPHLLQPHAKEPYARTGYHATDPAGPTDRQPS